MWVAIAVQVFLALLLAQGYDFRVEYVAGRNIVHGVSPYLGGVLSGWMAIGYGSQVQGLGEAPLWAVYLGLCYFLSTGLPILFNALSKIPILLANVALAYFSWRKGARGWRFFLLNFYLIITTVAWGKPDNLATLLAILALISAESASSSALLLSTSLLIKPLAVAILPAFVPRLKNETPRWRAMFITETVLFYAGLFMGPFLMFGWPLETVVNGLPSWFGHAGAFSPFNFIAVQTGTEQLPPSLQWMGYFVILGVVTLTAYAFVTQKPINILQYAVLCSAVFFTLRPWNSEQNLVILFTAFILLRGDLPSRWLWLIPTIFAFANNSPQQQLYLLFPTIIDSLNRLYAPIDMYRLWFKFLLSSAWLVVLWLNIRTLRSYHIVKQEIPA